MCSICRVIMKVITDYDYVYNTIDYNYIYFVFENYSYDYSNLITPCVTVITMHINKNNNIHTCPVTSENICTIIQQHILCYLRLCSGLNTLSLFTCQMSKHCVVCLSCSTDRIIFIFLFSYPLMRDSMMRLLVLFLVSVTGTQNLQQAFSI